MSDETKIRVAEYKDFPLNPTKEQLKEIRKAIGIDPNLKGLDLIKAFHEKYDPPFDEEWYQKIFNSRTIK